MDCTLDASFSTSPSERFQISSDLHGEHFDISTPVGGIGFGSGEFSASSPSIDGFGGVLSFTPVQISATVDPFAPSPMDLFTADAMTGPDGPTGASLGNNDLMPAHQPTAPDGAFF